MFNDSSGSAIAPGGPKVRLLMQYPNHFLVNFGCVAYRAMDEDRIHVTIFKAYFNWPGGEGNPRFAGIWVIGTADERGSSEDIVLPE